MKGYNYCKGYKYSGARKIAPIILVKDFKTEDGCYFLFIFCY